MTALPVRLALQTLRANLLRTVLSTLGIVMGAASLAAVLALGDGAEAFARRRIEAEGLQTILLEARTVDRIDGLRVPRATPVRLTPADASALSTALGSDTGVTFVAKAVVRWRARASAAAVAAAIVTAAPASDHAALAQGLAVAGAVTPPSVHSGRALSSAELASGARVAVVSAPVARRLAPGRAPEAAVGLALAIAGEEVRVVGVLPERAGRDEPVVLLPAAVLAAAGAQSQELPTLLVQAPDVEAVEALKTRAEQWGRTRYGDGVVVSATGLQRLRDVAQGILIFKLLMGAFTAVALLVGGIGIMNVLLASVLERTREIGVRRAVGARRRDIVQQFLAESVVIAGVGSLLGLAVGLGGAFAMTAIMRARTEALIYAAITPQTVLASIGAAVLTGVVFGLYPALRASRLAPVDAIRTE
jgi:putative ABC transport system permease protein